MSHEEQPNPAEQERILGELDLERQLQAEDDENAEKQRELDGDRYDAERGRWGNAP